MATSSVLCSTNKTYAAFHHHQATQGNASPGNNRSLQTTSSRRRITSSSSRILRGRISCSRRIPRSRISSGSGIIRVKAASSSGNAQKKSQETATDELLRLVEGEERGLRTQKDAVKRAQIIEAIDALADLGRGSTTTDSSLTSAWRMLWTSEKELLFIIKYAHLFGTQAGDILQVIDVRRGVLNNVIRFPPTGAFVVNSTLEVVSKQRYNFRFISATLKVGRRRFRLPPYGQGWSESVYMDEKIRVAKDIRGDYLVACRDPSSFEA